MAESKAVTPASAAGGSSQSIAVGLHEAALDSPTFRATAAHFAEQVDAIEKWLNGYISSTSKLMHDFLALEETINTYLSKTMPSAADGIIDNDYAFLALKRVGDGSREYWSQLLSSMKKMDHVALEPIRSFLVGDLRNFKEIKRVLEQSQRTFDSTLARYASQSKTKEPSALREDAFAVYETRKAYIQASMDFCQLAPQLRFTMDKLLVRVCGDIWKEMKRSRDAAYNTSRWTLEMDRVMGWAKEMEGAEPVFRRRLQVSRRDLGESASAEFQPSRELEDYSTSTVPYLGSRRGPMSVQPTDEGAVVSEKQGWLFLRTVTGKPVRHHWVRRWYYCRDGVFGWLLPAPQGVFQGDEIGVLLCNAKPAPGEERRFCFEVKTKSLTLLLQAETQSELTEWLEVFEVTKKKAFEESMNRSAASTPGGPDPAFSISPPAIPEFSAKVLDAQLGAGDDAAPAVERSGTLPVPAQDGGLTARASFDVNGQIPRRSITALGRDLSRDLVREEGESGREHAARIISKLDLHRKGNVSDGTGGISASSSSGGIASLLSAGHGMLPGNSMLGTSARGGGFVPSVDGSPSALAPLTLAKAPATTNLSRMAIITSSERPSTSSNGKLPTSIVANYWGSNIWGAMNVPKQPLLPRMDEDDPIGIVVSDAAQTPLSHASERGQPNEVLPPNYPPELRAQQSQFRLLFPHVPLSEKLVLVFRASWTSSGSGEAAAQRLVGDGRVYVTPENMYFYSQQMGLVMAYSLSLDIISEVTADAGRDGNLISVHLGQDSNDTGYTQIDIKVFLEDPTLLHARLNLLIDDLQAEEPMEINDIVTALLSIQREEQGRHSQSAESWEEVPADTPMDDGTMSGKAVERPLNELGPRLRLPRVRHGLQPKVHLPSHPVVYEPEDMKEMAAERHFEITPKSCFHVLFGDKSFVFPKLYFERRAQQITQGPWILADQGRMRRDFQFEVDYADMLGRSKAASVNDYQTIDVYSDHVTYVVTHVKTAWHLPYSSSFKIISKIVITHVAKSKCKLAVYVRIDWSKTPALSKTLVERQALHDAISDAEELAELATDQVRKLGPRSRTNRAIQVYGHVGQQTQVVVFSPGASESKKQAVTRRTLTTIVFETIRSFGESAVSSVIMWAFAGVRKLFKVITAQWLILVILGFSVMANLVFMSSESSNWWREQRAASFMRRLGVAPNAMMSRAIYIADIAEASGAAGHDLSFPQNSTCFATFKEILDATNMDAPWEDAGAPLTSSHSQSTARRLRQARQRMGSYRHDLLVAMRVVNSVEREMLQSEWENWLMSEKSLCDELEQILQSGKTPSGSSSTGKGPATGAEAAQKVLEKLSPKRRKALEEWRDGYCGSCRTDHQAVMTERTLSGSQ